MPTPSVAVRRRRHVHLFIGAIVIIWAALSHPTRVGAVSRPTFVVNSAADTEDAAFGDGVCATVANVCTLRAAITEANAEFAGAIIDLRSEP